MPVADETFLATLQNIPLSINAWVTTQQVIGGTTNFSNVTTATLIKPSAGRIVSISVVWAGSTVGHVYDAMSVNDVSRNLFVIPNTVGIIQLGIPTLYGILIVPGTAQIVSGVFS